MRTDLSTQIPIQRKEPTPLILHAGKGKLNRIERFNLRMVYLSFAWKGLDALCRFGLVHLGARWVDFCTRNLRCVHGLDRLPPAGELGSFVLATNHLSYFDLFVTSMVLIKSGLRNRMIYPVRSRFFYDHPLGLFVNAIMSFGSMYPPIFRDKKRRTLNRVGLDEIAWFMRNRKMCVGIHPEGKRNQGDDPYSLLSPQAGIGQLIHNCRVPVIPVFINGLDNNLKLQLASNFNGKGKRINVVFGAPLDFSEYYAQEGRTVPRNIAEETLKAIHELGQEEKKIRAEQEQDFAG